MYYLHVSLANEDQKMMGEYEIKQKHEFWCKGCLRVLQGLLLSQPNHNLNLTQLQPVLG